MRASFFVVLASLCRVSFPLQQHGTVTRRRLPSVCRCAPVEVSEDALMKRLGHLFERSNRYSDREWLEAMKLVAVQENVSIEAYNLALKCCARGGEWQTAVGVIRTLTAGKRQVSPNAETFTVAGVVAARCGKAHEARRVLDQARLHGLATTRLYTAVVGAYGRSKDEKRALEVFERLRSDAEKNFTESLDARAFTAAIDACAGVGDYKNASQIYQSMRDFKIKPNTRTFRGLIAAASGASHFEAAEKYLLEAEQDSQEEEDFVPLYEAFLGGLSKNGQESKRALKLLNRMENLIFKNDLQKSSLEASRCYTQAIGACKFDYESGLAILKRFDEALQKSPTAYKCKRDRRAAYTQAIDACGRAKDLDAAMGLFFELPVAPDLFLYNVALTACRRSGKDSRDACVRVWQRLLSDRRVSPDAISVSEAVACLSLTSDSDADSIVREALALGVSFKRKRLSLDSDYEVDVSGLPFPLARSVLRLALEKFKEKKPLEDLVFITGVGVRATVQADHTSLRSHLLETLNDTLNLTAAVSPTFPGAVVVRAEDLALWLEQRDYDQEQLQESDSARGDHQRRSALPPGRTSSRASSIISI